MKVERIDSERLAKMREEWDSLLERSNTISPMLFWEWLWSWWEAYRDVGTMRELYVLVARADDGRLVAAAPFVRRHVRVYGIHLSRIEFIGTGEAEEDETCSELLDIVVDPAYAAEALEGISEYLTRDEEWDELVCRDVLSDSQSAVSLLAERMAAGGFAKHTANSGHCPWIALPETWPAYLDTLSPKREKRIEYERRHLSRAARVESNISVEPGEVMASYGSFVVLHQRLWNARGRPGCFASRHFSSFMEKVTNRLAERRNVMLQSLIVNGEPVAVFFLLLRGARIFYYNSGVDPDEYRSHSPGNIGLGHVIEGAIQRGMKEFHFFKGRLESYKGHWTDKTLPVSTVVVCRRSWRTLLVRRILRFRGRVV
jgi:CelD/BcsL family acetyltransferase involved in cellulose biosynthesis